MKRIEGGSGPVAAPSRLREHPALAPVRAAKRSLVLSWHNKTPMVTWPTAEGWMLRSRELTVIPPIGLSPSRLEQNTLDFFCWGYQPQPGDVVLDVGAGLGTELPTFSKLVGPTGRVVAIEAHPDTFDVASRMVCMNRLDNVEAHQVAIWDESGELTISDLGNPDINSVVDDGRGQHAEAVKALTLDEFTKELGLDHIDFLKMNIEGAERQAVVGGRETLHRTTHVAISCHDFVADFQGGSNDMRTRSQVLGVLEELDFDVREREDPRPFIRSYLFGHRRGGGTSFSH